MHDHNCVGGHCNSHQGSGNDNMAVMALGALLIGGVIGAGVALLFAPQSGEETRDMIAKRAKDLKKQAEDKLSDFEDMAGDRADEIRSRVKRAARELKR